jgi:hypothetical protein
MASGETATAQVVDQEAPDADDSPATADSVVAVSAAGDVGTVELADGQEQSGSRQGQPVARESVESTSEMSGAGADKLAHTGGAAVLAVAGLGMALGGAGLVGAAAKREDEVEEVEDEEGEPKPEE